MVTFKNRPFTHLSANYINRDILERKIQDIRNNSFCPMFVVVVVIVISFIYFWYVENVFFTFKKSYF